MGLFKFKEKEEKPYRVVHYEGIDNVGVDIPCTLLIKNNILNIKFNSDMNITLQMERVIKFEAMSENEFMMKYKNTNGNTKKLPVSYLVITYTSKENEEKRIVLWAANYREMKYFTDLHYKYKKPMGNIEL